MRPDVSPYKAQRLRLIRQPEASGTEWTTVGEFIADKAGYVLVTAVGVADDYAEARLLRRNTFAQTEAYPWANAEQNLQVGPGMFDIIAAVGDRIELQIRPWAGSKRCWLVSAAATISEQRIEARHTPGIVVTTQPTAQAGTVGDVVELEFAVSRPVTWTLVSTDGATTTAIESGSGSSATVEVTVGGAVTSYQFQFTAGPYSATSNTVTVTPDGVVNALAFVSPPASTVTIDQGTLLEFDWVGDLLPYTVTVTVDGDVVTTLSTTTSAISHLLPLSGEFDVVVKVVDPATEITTSTTVTVDPDAGAPAWTATPAGTVSVEEGSASVLTYRGTGSIVVRRDGAFVASGTNSVTVPLSTLPPGSYAVSAVLSVGSLSTASSTLLTITEADGGSTEGDSYYLRAVAAYPAFTPTRTVNVTTRAQLLAAFADLTDGDDIVMTATADYGTQDMDGLTVATKARLRPAEGVTATFRSVSSTSPLYMRQGSDHWIIGHPDGRLVLDGGGQSLSCLGVGLNSGTATSGSGKGACSDVYFSNVYMTDSGQAGIKCGANSDGITWDELCQVTRTGRATPDYGEGLYVGSASGGGDETTNIEFRGEISFTTAEGVDAKLDAEVTLTGARIHDIAMASASTNNKGAIANRSGKTLDATGVRIWSVRRASGADAVANVPVGIVCSSGTVVADEAAIWGCGGAAFWVFDSGEITGANVTAYGNNVQSASAFSFAHDGSTGPITITASVYAGTHNAAVSTSSTATAGDFVGPIVGAAVGVDGFEGSGFALAPSSSIPSTRGAFGAASAPTPGSGDVAYHGVWSASYASGQTTVATTVPSGGTGKVAVLAVSGTSGQTPSTPSGWTLLSVFNDAVVSVELYARLLDGTGGSNAPTVTGGAIRSVIMATLTGTSVALLTVASGPSTSASATSHDPAAVTVAVDGGLVLSVFASVFSARTWAVPSNMTSAANESDVARGLAVAHAFIDTAQTFDPAAWTTADGATAAALATIVALPA